MAASTNTTTEDASFAEQTALTSLLGAHPKVKILAVLLSEGRDVNVSHIAEQAGMSRSTVYDHLDDLLNIGVIEKTREIGGSPLYQMNRDNKVAKDIATLEWDLIELIADE